MAQATRQAQQLTPDEAAELIREATRIQHRSAPTLSHEDVHAMAKELGLTPESIDRALAARAQRQQKTARSRKAIRALFRHTTSFVTTLTGLTLLDYVTGPGWWVHFVAIPWGVGLAFHALSTVERVANERLFRSEGLE